MKFSMLKNLCILHGRVLVIFCHDILDRWQSGNVFFFSNLDYVSWSFVCPQNLQCRGIVDETEPGMNPQ